VKIIRRLKKFERFYKIFKIALTTIILFRKMEK